jgi:hypothetical protein
MIQTSATPTQQASAATLPRAAMRLRPGAEKYVAHLKAELSIGRDQTEAWAAFAEALSENSRRMCSSNDGGDVPFGALSDRLAALDSMRRAAKQLFAVLRPAQRRTAVQLLPLCCLPQTSALV